MDAKVGEIYEGERRFRLQVRVPAALRDDIEQIRIEDTPIASFEEVTYQIVGDDEADLKEGKISISSPIARALIGKESGDVAAVQAPGGVREYEIIEVRYI